MSVITLETLKRNFNQTFSKKSKSLIDSFYIFGSLAREEKISEEGDVDSVLLLKNLDTIDVKDLMQLSLDIRKLDEKLGVEIDHVIVTQIELFELLSPMLIKNIYTDGASVFGKDLKKEFEKYLSLCPQNQLLNSFLRSMMFHRHQFRKKVLKMDLIHPQDINHQQILSLIKDIFFAARDYLFFSSNILITRRKDLCSYFSVHAKGNDWYVNFPTYALNIKSGLVSLNNKARKGQFIKKAFDFMEITTHNIIEDYQRITGKKKLDLRAF